VEYQRRQREKPEIKARDRAAALDYYYKNRSEMNKKAVKYHKLRRKTDLNFRLRNLISTRIRRALERGSVRSKTVELLGCEISELRVYLQSLFQPGMSWENYGEWHIDHIRPCASFDLSDPGQQKQCFHYANLQPLWARDNLTKGDRWLPTESKTGTISMR